MNLAIFLITSLAATLAAMLPLSRGPLDLAASAFVAWILPALLAIAWRNSPTPLGRYGWAAGVLAFIVAMMWIGSPA